MGTLYVDRKGVIVKLDGSALAFYSENGREGTVPIHPLKRVIVIGGITIETPALNRLCDENIAVLFLSGRRMRFHGRLQGKLHNNGLLRVRQYEKSISSFSVECSHQIVSQKLSAQTALLSDALLERPDLRYPLASARETLEKISNALSLLDVDKSPVPSEKKMEDFISTLQGYEGSAAAAYFSGYTTLFAPSLRFIKRTRRPPEDPVNAILSLCYTLIHYEMVREIETIGLDPTIGFYHKFDYGRESLASDLIEPFRPQVDRFAWAIFRDRTFTDRDFAYNAERPGCYLKKGSRKRFYPIYEDWARQIRPELTGEVRRLASAIMGKACSDEWERIEYQNPGEGNDA